MRVPRIYIYEIATQISKRPIYIYIYIYIIVVLRIEVVENYFESITNHKRHILEEEQENEIWVSLLWTKKFGSRKLASDSILNIY